MGISDICDDTLWNGNIVTCPVCGQLGTLVRYDTKSWDGRPCDGYNVGHMNRAGRMESCIYNYTQNKIERKELENK